MAKTLSFYVGERHQVDKRFNHYFSKMFGDNPKDYGEVMKEAFVFYCEIMHAGDIREEDIYFKKYIKDEQDKDPDKSIGKIVKELAIKLYDLDYGKDDE